MMLHVSVIDTYIDVVITSLLIIMNACMKSIQYYEYVHGVTVYPLHGIPRW